VARVTKFLFTCVGTVHNAAVHPRVTVVVVSPPETHSNGAYLHSHPNVACTLLCGPTRGTQVPAGLLRDWLVVQRRAETRDVTCVCSRHAHLAFHVYVCDQTVV
jgi:hypothetical protein